LARLNGLKIEFEALGSEDVLSPALRQALYRIICELTANAIRHGGCTTIKVAIQMDASGVLLAVTDDGCGFDPQQVRSGLGLNNVRSLVASFGGSFQLANQAGTGTQVTCYVPAGAGVH
jgi:signal transduction histidine kinase